MYKSIALTLLSAQTLLAAPQSESQATCPKVACTDNGADVDLYADKFGGSWGYLMRNKYGVGKGGACQTQHASKDGCNDIYPVGQSPMNVCIDWRSGRGHIINKDTKQRDCYHVASKYTCGEVQWVAWFDKKVECTW